MSHTRTRTHGVREAKMFEVFECSSRAITRVTAIVRVVEAGHLRASTRVVVTELMTDAGTEEWWVVQRSGGRALELRRSPYVNPRHGATML